RLTHDARFFHANTIHSTPMMATSNTDSPISIVRRLDDSPSFIAPPRAPASGFPYVSPAVFSADGAGVAMLTAKRTAVQITNSRTAEWRKLKSAIHSKSEAAARFALVVPFAKS